ncbi:AraC-like DNA-binding protein [Nocardia tenerifensis]|uniref:AraC-like DNA-binding protein n=1 Tax=Nocardia tenerifensis TaxID=228006 RepID=A0A318KCE3_9NOCA|nr:helix-turn-helix domain-containing protein [Nocardia tenerifensis]PXX56287.1 AraC-like DNA-binding protein [Nocardia tenerifensis]
MPGKTLSTVDVAPEFRQDYWRSVVCEEIAAVDLTPAERSPVRGWMVVGDVGAVRVLKVLSPAGETARTPTLIRRADPDELVICVHHAGYMVFRQDEREIVVQPGDVTLADLSRPYSLTRHDRTRSCLVKLARSMLPLDPQVTAELTAVALPGASGAGAIIGGLVQQLARSLDDDTLVGNVRLSMAVVDVFAAALAERTDRVVALPEHARHTALMARIQAFIEAHLADPELSLADIAAAHHISVRYLQKLFTMQGVTVSGWIRTRRLDRCRRDLLDPGRRGESVVDIGSRWGLPRAAHFNRIFAARFGAPPGEYRRTTVLPNSHQSTRERPQRPVRESSIDRARPADDSALLQGDP